MREPGRIRVALQKSGRLTDKSLALLKQCGLSFDWSKNRLLSRCQNFPLDLMLVRDDDIPEYVYEGTCELGIVGENVLVEKLSKRQGTTPKDVKVVKELGFGKCRLSLAIPQTVQYPGIEFFNNKRIATSYPAALREFLQDQAIQAEVIEISGSVEIAPTLEIADGICDLVSTGSTLKSNGLKEVQTVLKSQSVMIQTHQDLDEERQMICARLLDRIEGVMKAAETKYVMMNAPRSALDEIRSVLPGMEHPSVMTLDGSEDKVAIHAVCRENIFWETMDRLKAAGASSVLVLPIEKII